MIPLQDLLNRIRWDKEFARGDYNLGYYDRIEDRVVIVPLGQVFFSKGDHFSFGLVNERGELISIPFHRVRQIYKNGQLIWSREKKE